MYLGETFRGLDACKVPDFCPEKIDVRNGPLAKLFVVIESYMVLCLDVCLEFMSASRGGVLVLPEQFWGNAVHGENSILSLFPGILHYASMLMHIAPSKM